MTTYSLTLRSEHFEKLREHLLRPDGAEHVAYLLCTMADIRIDPWDQQAHRKFLGCAVVPVPDEQVVELDINLVTWQTTSFLSALKKSHLTGQFVAIVHNHPLGQGEFSVQDDSNELDLAELAVKRHGPDTPIMSIVLTPDGVLFGRIWLHPNPKGHVALRMIRVLGTDFRLQYPGRGAAMSCNGLSASGSGVRAGAETGPCHASDRYCRLRRDWCAVAMLLARLGVGHLVLIDNDIVDRTNLNRLHGARQADADAMRPKVEVVARSITELSLGMRVVPIEAWVGDPGCRDALRSCDLIFGCTDDNEGRFFLSRLAYFYLIPVIDLELAIDVSRTEPPEIKCLDGRVTVVMPPHACLACRGVIDPVAARDEALRRSSPTEYERRKAEAYVAGEGDPRPAVVTFTTEVATMGVNEMLHRLQGFRGPNGAVRSGTEFHLAEDFRPGSRPASGCRICDDATVWGKGDVDPFLDRVD